MRQDASKPLTDPPTLSDVLEAVDLLARWARHMRGTGVELDVPSSPRHAHLVTLRGGGSLSRVQELGESGHLLEQARSATERVVQAATKVTTPDGREVLIRSGLGRIPLARAS